MGTFDHLLEQAEQRKAAENPVRLAQKELAPVRVWAETQKQEFLAGETKLRPRIEEARALSNRLTRLLGAPPDEPRRLWEELERVRQGIPATYEVIKNDIDTLTPYLVGQPAYLKPLQQRRNCPPGNINTLVEVLERLERSLDEHIDRVAGAPR